MSVTQTSEGIVYIIRCTLDSSFCYIGSSFQRIDKRFTVHKQYFNLWLKDKIKYNEYSIFPYFLKYGIENFYIKLIKPYNVIREHNKDFKHLWVYETLWINKMKKQCVNKYLPFSPLCKNKIHRKPNDKKYYENNIEKIKEYNRKYYKNNLEKIKKQVKKYRENNIEQEKIRQIIKSKKYREKNKEQLKQKISCLNCGSIVTHRHLSRHRKTLKCNKYKNLVAIVCIEI